MRAHRFQEIDEKTGATLTESAVTSVEINPSLPLSMFSPPIWDRTPLQQMIQRIYDERDEARSVLATYRDFTQLVDMHSGAVGDAVDFVGYQCLKMGHAILRYSCSSKTLPITRTLRALIRPRTSLSGRGQNCGGQSAVPACPRNRPEVPTSHRRARFRSSNQRHGYGSARR